MLEDCSVKHCMIYKVERLMYFFWRLLTSSLKPSPRDKQLLRHPNLSWHNCRSAIHHCRYSTHVALIYAFRSDADDNSETRRAFISTSLNSGWITRKTKGDETAPGRWHFTWNNHFNHFIPNIAAPTRAAHERRIEEGRALTDNNAVRESEWRHSVGADESGVDFLVEEVVEVLWVVVITRFQIKSHDDGWNHCRVHVSGSKNMKKIEEWNIERKREWSIEVRFGLKAGVAFTSAKAANVHHESSVQQARGISWRKK